MSKRALPIAILFVAALFSALAAAAPKGPARGLVIITPARFSDALAEFVRFKRQELPTRLVTLEEVLQRNPGEDDPARVKHYLYRAWREQRAGYALLVGDADVFPVRFMVLDRVTPAAFDYAFYPSDLYYADVARADGSFDDWNAAKDGFHSRYYGEVRGEKNKTDPINYDRVNYRPVLAVGRWPVSTEAEVRIVAQKTIAYERGVVDGTKPGLQRVALLSVGGWVDSREPLDRMADRLRPNWSVAKAYYRDAQRNDGTPPPNEHQLDEVLDDGVGLVLHAGHGSDDSWAGCFSVPNLNALKNRDRLPVMLSAGCSTARFCTLPPYEPYVDESGRPHEGADHGEVFTSPPPAPAAYQSDRYNPTGLGEQLLRRGPDGAVAYIGCNTGSQPCALTLLAGFVDGLATEPRPRVGDCWAHAVADYYDHEHLATLKPTADWYPASIFFQAMKYMLYGDPSARLPGGIGRSAMRVDAGGRQARACQICGSRLPWNTASTRICLASTR